MKHREPAAQTVHATPPTVDEIIGWVAPAGIADKNTRKKDVPLDPREEKVFTIEGDLWRAKVEGNDCDFHLELSAPGGTMTSDRIIAEIPQGPSFAAAREVLIQALIAAHKAKPGHSINANFQSAPLRVRLAGYGFYDSAHYSAKHPKRGTRHGTKYVATLWEVHPAWKVEVVGH